MSLPSGAPHVSLFSPGRTCQSSLTRPRCESPHPTEDNARRLSFGSGGATSNLDHSITQGATRMTESKSSRQDLEEERRTALATPSDLARGAARDIAAG